MHSLLDELKEICHMYTCTYIDRERCVGATYKFQGKLRAPVDRTTWVPRGSSVHVHSLTLNALLHGVHVEARPDAIMRVAASGDDRGETASCIPPHRGSSFSRNPGALYCISNKDNKRKCKC